MRSIVLSRSGSSAAVHEPCWGSICFLGQGGNTVASGSAGATVVGGAGSWDGEHPGGPSCRRERRSEQVDCSRFCSSLFTIIIVVIVDVVVTTIRVVVERES